MQCRQYLKSPKPNLTQPNLSVSYDTTLSESQFNPIRNSKTEEAITGEGKERSRVRKREDEEGDESGEDGMDRRRVKLEMIEERVETSKEEEER